MALDTSLQPPAIFSEARLRVLRGLLFTVTAALPFLHTGKLQPEVVGAAWSATALVGMGAWVLHTTPRVGRVIASLGLLLTATLWTLPRTDRPGWVFLSLLALSALLSSLWPPRPLHVRRRSAVQHPVPEVPAAAVAAVTLWFIIAVGRTVPGWREAPELGMVGLMPTVLALPVCSGVSLPRPSSVAWLVLGAAIAIAGTIIAMVGGGSGLLIFAPLLAPLCALLAVRPERGPDDGGVAWRTLVDHPPRLLVASFAVQCLVGGMLLSLPVSSAKGVSVTLIDALFTAVSATCVTGLTVVDVAHDYSLTGQLLLLALIQTGGLGIMTFSASAFVLLAQRMSVRHESAAADLVGAENIAELRRALVRVLALTFGAEALGAAILTAAFWRLGDALPVALWRGVFTAISSFCNAGFTLQRDSFEGFAQQPVILYTVTTLVILGGLGPAVVASLPVAWRSPARLSLQAQIVLRMTAALLVVPTMLIAVLEWNRSLAALPWIDRVNNAWFQAVTLRTAGFHSFSLVELAPATISLMLLAMFIGGSPGSTAGGAKTTTIAILGLAIRAAIRGESSVDVLHRHIPSEIVYRSGAVATLTAGICMVAFFALQVTHEMPYEVALFEVVSATATVGLSIGGTPLLDDFGKLVIIACMFAGRVGPLTLFLLVDPARRRHVHLPNETVAVG